MHTYKLLIQEPPLQVLPTLAAEIGLNEAIVLQQLHYWLGKDSAKEKEGKTWIYNTHSDWQKQFPFWSDKTIRRTLKSLLDKNLVHSKNLNTNKFLQTKWYGINYEELESIAAKYFQLQENKGSSAPGQSDQVSLTADDNAVGQNDHMDLPVQSDHLVKVTNSDVVNMTSSDMVKMTSCNKEHRLPENNQRCDARDVNHFSQDEFAQKALDIWNQTVALPQNPVVITPNRQRNLTHVLKTIFGTDLLRWQSYCDLISSTPFLMGETPRSDWRATLDWSLDQENMSKILEGNYEERAPQKKTLNSHENTDGRGGGSKRAAEALKSIENNPGASKSLKETQKKILEKLGAEKYIAWFSRVTLGKKARESLTLVAPTRFTADYIQQHYEADLVVALGPKGVDQFRVYVEVGKK